MRTKALSVGILATLGFGWLAASEARMSVPDLAAGISEPLHDRDGDGLPDLLEFVVNSDPDKPDADSDGRPDLLELIDYTSPLVADVSTRVPNGLRVVLNTTEDGPRHILWVHLLLRLPSGNLSDLKGLALFLDFNGDRYPATPLLFTTLADYTEVRDRARGLFARVTLRIPLFDGFSRLGPMTFGAYARIHSTTYGAGAMLFHTVDIADFFFTLVPVASSRSIVTTFQATSARSRNPFWATNKRCVFQLEVQGVGQSGHLCEVEKAKCETANNRRCISNCQAMKGQTFFVPDGLPLILGG